MSNVVKTLPLALALALVASKAHALGLGTLEVKSQLNQPLVAEIPLIGVAPADLERISVRLASPEAFERVGLPRPAGVTANLQFSVGRNARGEPVVRVTTRNRVDDPFVAFLLEAEWDRGSVVREFTALVDPPHIAAATVTPMTAPRVVAAPTPPPAAPPASTPAPAAVEPTPAVATPEPVAAEPLPDEPAPSPAATVEPTPPPPVAAAEPVAPPEPAPEPLPVPAPEPIAAAPTPTPEPTAAQPEPQPLPAPLPPAPPPAEAPAADRREVAGGDTLSEIAEETRQGVTAAQMMLAIQRANPDAFIRDNINLLRKGAVLRIPTAAEAEDLGRADAEAQVREQMVAWRAIQPAPAPTPAPGEAPAITPPPAADSRTAPAVASGPSSAPGGRLEIAPPAGAGARAAQSGAASGGSGSELRAELEQAREDLSARDAELRELRSRLTEQETLANEQQRLIELKDSQLSAMEQALREQRQAADGATGETGLADAAAAATTSDVTGIDPAPIDPLAQPPAADPAAAAIAAPAAAPAPVTPSPEAPAAAAPEAVGEGAAAATAAEPWFRNPLVLGAAGLVLVGALVAMLLRRRGGEPKRPLPVVPPATAGRSRLSDDADFLSNLPPPGATDAPAGDGAAPASKPAMAPAVAAATAVPASSAAAAVDARPADLDAHVSLLRQRYNAGDIDGFLKGAERMRAQVTEQGDPRWREVVVMGMGLVPGHALFREVQWNPISGADVRTRPAPAATASKGAAGAPASAPPPASADAFSERETAERPVAKLAPAEEVGLDDTRLELAKAYIEIGDTDGARGMLEEVLAEGSPAARAEAQRLLKSIG